MTALYRVTSAAMLCLLTMQSGCVAVVGDASTAREDEQVGEARDEFDPFTLILLAIAAGAALGAGLRSAGYGRQAGNPDPFWPHGPPQRPGPHWETL